MDTTRLHAATEELASCLSEITVGDLSLVVATGGDVGDLYCDLLIGIESTTAGLVGSTPMSAPDLLRRCDLRGLADGHGGGFENLYRESVRSVEAAFANAELGDNPQRDGALPEATAALLYEDLVAATESAIVLVNELLDVPPAAGTRT